MAITSRPLYHAQYALKSNALLPCSLVVGDGFDLSVEISEVTVG